MGFPIIGGFLQWIFMNPAWNLVMGIVPQDHPLFFSDFPMEINRYQPSGYPHGTMEPPQFSNTTSPVEQVPQLGFSINEKLMDIFRAKWCWILSGHLTVFYWTWPSLHSWFSYQKRGFSHIYVSLPESPEGNSDIIWYYIEATNSGDEWSFCRFSRSTPRRFPRRICLWLLNQEALFHSATIGSSMDGSLPMIGSPWSHSGR